MLDSIPAVVHPTDAGIQKTTQDFNSPRVILLPRGFTDLIDADRLSPSTVRLLVRLEEFVPGQPHASQATFQSFEDACPCLKAEQTTFEQLLCLTVMIYCNIAFSQSSIGLQPTLAFGARRNMLIKAMSTFNTNVQVEKNCMLWMFIVSIRSCTDKRGRVSLEGSMLLTEAHRRYTTLTWPRVESMLSMFAWNSKLIEHLPQFFELD